MAFYLIGIGLDKKSISADALEILNSCDEIYLENYTVNFPYKIEELEDEYNGLLNKHSPRNEMLGRVGATTKSDSREKGGIESINPKIKITELKRSQVEDESALKEAKKKNIALLVYGDALSATTHMQLILACKKQKIPFKIFHNASILIAIAQTGLQPYKFGKTASMPNWAEHKNRPTSFMNYIKENNSINAHTLLLTDIGLKIKDAINQLEESAKKETVKLPEKILALSNAGTSKQKIFYDSPENLQNKKVEIPFCLIIPSQLHFIENEALEELNE